MTYSKYILTTVLSTFILLSVGWGQELEWSQTFGGSDYDIGFSVQQTIDGGYIMTGYTSTEFGQDILLIKTDLHGNQEWIKEIDISDYDCSYSVQQTIDGGYIMTGFTISLENGGFDICLIKTDSNGNEEWIQVIGGDSGDFMGYSVKQTTDYGYIIFGYSSLYGIGEYDYFLVKTDQYGNEQWNQTYDETDYDNGNSVQQTNDGGYILLGFSSINGGVGTLLIKVDSQGNEEWRKIFLDSFAGYSVQQTIDNGYIFIGGKIINENGQIVLIKTDSEGNEQWNQLYGENYPESGFSVDQTLDQGYILVGSSYPLGYGTNPNLFLIKTDSEGNEQWNQIFGGDERDEGLCVHQTNDGGYIIGGYTESFGNGSSDVWLIKIESEYQVGDINYDSSIDILDITLLVDQVLGFSEPEYFNLSDIYPDGDLNILDVVILVDMILNG